MVAKPQGSLTRLVSASGHHLGIPSLEILGPGRDWWATVNGGSPLHEPQQSLVAPKFTHGSLAPEVMLCGDGNMGGD